MSGITKSNFRLAAICLLVSLTFTVQAQVEFDSHTLVTGFLNGQHAVAADLDGDQDLDLVGGTFTNGDCIWWENDSDFIFTEHQIDRVFRTIRKVQVEDLDNDGDLDIVGFEIYGGNDCGSLDYWENDGFQNFNRHSIFDAISQTYSYCIEDIDSDGDLDIFSASTYRYVYWWENNGDQPATFTQHTISENSYCTHAVDAEDINSDGFMDLITADWNGYVSGWMNDGCQTFTRRHIGGLEEASLTTVRIVELNGDDSVDVISGCSSILSWQEIECWDNYFIARDFCNGYVSLLVEDLDLDRDFDLIVTGEGGTDHIYWFENNGMGIFTQHILASNQPHFRSISSADMDQDGDIDILATHNIYNDGSIIWFENLTIRPTVSVSLQGGYFELVSLSLAPENLEAANVFNSIQNLMIVYQDNGAIYLPPIVNTIHTVTITEGYQIYCSDDSQWQLAGDFIDPETEYSLAANRWNWLGYPYFEPVNVEIALTEIEDVLQILMNDEGQIWLPGLLNTLGEMTPGEGYFTFVAEDVTFCFHNEALLRNTIPSETPVVELPIAEGAPTPTGLPYLVLVHLTDDLRAQNPATVELFDGSLLVGKSTAQEIGGFIPVIAWGGDDELGVSGFETGNPIVIKVKSSEGTIIASDESLSFGKGAYGEITLDVSNINLPSSFLVGAAYPNPFNPTLTVPFSLPKAGTVVFTVYNLLGQQVFETSGNFPAGRHEFSFEASQTGKELVSGLYCLVIQYEGRVSAQKALLLK